MTGFGSLYGATDVKIQKEIITLHAFCSTKVLSIGLFHRTYYHEPEMSDMSEIHDSPNIFILLCSSS